MPVPFMAVMKSKGCAAAKVIGHRLLTTEVGVRSIGSPCGNFGGKSGTVSDFSPSTLFSPVISAYRPCFVKRG
jgi:hypothetical protein